MADDHRPKRASTPGELIRPDGRVEPTTRPRPHPAEGNYASQRPGRDDAQAVQNAARSDRRRRRRLVIDPLTGRLVDLEA